MIAYTVLLLSMLVAAAPPSAPIIGGTHPHTSVPFSRRVHPSTGTIAGHDRVRAAQLYEMGKARASGRHAKRQTSLPITSQVVTYVAEVGVGSPPTNYSLIIDTGSSNTWVGAGKSYVKTKTSCPTDQIVDVTYGSGGFLGYEVNDTVKLTKDLVISQSIGVAELSEGFDGVDGILGIGPTDLTEGTVMPDGSAIPTVTDNLFSQGKITQKVVGVYFAPSSKANDTNGEMTFGAADNSKTTGPIAFAPITSTSPSSEFFGIDQSITYGTKKSTILDITSGIVDTGTTLTLLASDAFNRYMSLTGATEDRTTGLLRISPENYANLQSLSFSIAGTTFEFTRNAQTFPRALNSAIGGSAGAIYLIIGDLGQDSGSGLDFINGMSFLERYYSLFDSTNNQVGLATTAHTFDTTN
ncbi:hypothetical protein ACEPAH_2690 [Sanghuangporus vaninii]